MESALPTAPDDETLAPADQQAEGEGGEDGSEIDWDNVAAETRIMLDLNRSAAQAREQQGQQP